MCWNPGRCKAEKLCTIRSSRHIVPVAGDRAMAGQYIRTASDDSAFPSVRTAVDQSKAGLFFIGIVQKASKSFAEDICNG